MQEHGNQHIDIPFPRCCLRRPVRGWRVDVLKMEKVDWIKGQIPTCYRAYIYRVFPWRGTFGIAVHPCESPDCKNRWGCLTMAIFPNKKHQHRKHRALMGVEAWRFENVRVFGRKKNSPGFNSPTWKDQKKWWNCVALELIIIDHYCIIILFIKVPPQCLWKKITWYFSLQQTNYASHLVGSSRRIQSEPGMWFRVSQGGSNTDATVPP